METFKVIIDETAENDLLDILLYISNVLKNPYAAKRIFTSIREQVMSLENMPFRHAVVSEEPYASMGIRKIPIENYIAFYFVDEQKSTVHVFRVLYNRREWQNLV